MMSNDTEKLYYRLHGFPGNLYRALQGNKFPEKTIQSLDPESKNKLLDDLKKLFPGEVPGMHRVDGTPRVAEPTQNKDEWAGWFRTIGHNFWVIQLPTHRSSFRKLVIATAAL